MLRLRPSKTLAPLFRSTSRSYNFASPSYVSCFGNYPEVPTTLAESTLAYLDSYSPNTWHDDPIRTLLKDQELKESSNPIDTLDAFNNVRKWT